MSKNVNKKEKQAGAELGQAQYKMGLNFTLIFYWFCFSRFGLVELVKWILFAGLIEKIWFGIFGLVHLVLYISDILLGRFDFVDAVLYIWFNRFG